MGTGEVGRVVRRMGVAAAAVLLSAAAGSAQSTCAAPSNAIRIVGAVDSAVTITAGDMTGMEIVTVDAPDHEGVEHRYAGPTLRALLDHAGVPGGAELEGHLSAYVVVEARDGYRVTYALAELDGGYWDTPPLLALLRDGAPLRPDAAPFQVIAPDTPKHGRWVRQVACLRVAYPE
jgi:hypothetical protein